MRKIMILALLFVMATCVAFAEGGQTVEPSSEPAVTETGSELTVMEPSSEPAVTISLDEVTMTLDPTEYVWKGTAIEPVPVLTYNGEALGAEEYTLRYEKNTGVGTAAVIAEFAKGGRFDAGEKKLEFTIKKEEPQPVLISLSKATITLSKTTYSKTGSQIKPVPTLEYNGKMLTKGTDYTVSYKNNVNVGTATVTATAVNGSNYTGAKSVTFQIIPKKPATAKITSVKCNKPYVKVTWKKVTCTGYQLQTSRKSNFANPVTYKLKTNSKNVIKMKNKLTYYIRVRAYNTEGGKTTYGSWSSTSKKVYTTGPVGNKYSKNGAYVKDKTIKYDGNYYYYNSAGLKSGCSEKMWDKVKNNKSKTKYLIAVDCTRNRTCIFQGKKGNWKLKYYWKCTTGKKSTPTIKGNFKVCGKVSHFGESNGYSVWHATRIKYEYYFHSVLYKPWSKKTIIAGKLGKNLSHGCVRLKKSNAKWIYKNCKSGTRIVIY